MSSRKPRYNYVDGSGANGVVVQDGGLFIYSHHGSDPCGGRLVNAFDMVRLHLYGHLDEGHDEDGDPTELPSYQAMSDRARDIAAVELAFQADMDELDEERILSMLDDLPPREGDIADNLDDDEDEPEPLPEQTDAIKDVPKHLLTIPGKLGLGVDYFNALSPKPQPQFAVQANLVIGSVVNARYYRTSNNNYTSHYYINIGRSGAGKEFPKGFVEDLLTSAGLDELIGQGDYTSMAAVVDLLHDAPRHVTMIDEMGEYLAQYDMARDANRLEVRKQYLELWGRNNGITHGKAYATGKMTAEQKQGSRKRVKRPALTLMGMSVPSTFFQNLSTEDVRKGFLARFTIVNSDMPRTKYSKPRRVKPPKELLGWMRRTADPFDGDDLDVDYHPGVTPDIGNPVNPPDPIEVPFTAKADDLFNAFEDRMLKRQDDLEDTGLHELLNRSHEKAMKLSLIVALSCESDEVKEEHAQWAVDYVEFYDLQFLDLCKRLLNANQYSELCEKLAHSIYKAGKNGISIGKLRDNHKPTLGRMGEREMREVLYFLGIDHGIIESKIKTGSGQNRTRLLHPKFVRPR